MINEEKNCEKPKEDVQEEDKTGKGGEPVAAASSEEEEVDKIDWRIKAKKNQNSKGANQKTKVKAQRKAREAEITN